MKRLLMLLLIMTIGCQAGWKDTTTKVGSAIFAVGLVAASPITTPTAAVVAVGVGVATVAGTAWNMSTNEACKRETFYSKHNSECSLAKTFE